MSAENLIFVKIPQMLNENHTFLSKSPLKMLLFGPGLV